MCTIIKVYEIRINVRTNILIRSLSFGFIIYIVDFVMMSNTLMIVFFFIRLFYQLRIKSF